MTDTNFRQKAFSPEEISTYALENGEPEFDPGEDQAYSNTNYILLGMALEAATGQESRIYLHHSYQLC